MPRFLRKDLQHQKTLKQTKMLDNNTAKGVTNINKGVRLSTKQHSSCGYIKYKSNANGLEIHSVYLTKITKVVLKKLLG
jgi:uncharacterized protein YpuA (DUF1002 family)